MHASTYSLICTGWEAAVAARGTNNDLGVARVRLCMNSFSLEGGRVSYAPRVNNAGVLRRRIQRKSAKARAFWLGRTPGGFSPPRLQGFVFTNPVRHTHGQHAGIGGEGA